MIFVAFTMISLMYHSGQPVSFDPYYMLSFMLVDKLNVSSHVARGYIYQGYWHFIVKLKVLF